MSAGGKFLAILGLALLMFFIPVFIQEHEIFLNPLFSKVSVPSQDLSTKENTVRDTVRKFNSLLDTFYTRGDVRILSTLPASEEVKKNILLEREFLRRKGLSPEISLARLDMGKVLWLDSNVASLGTVEIWEKEKNHMVYTVENIKGQWIVTDSSVKEPL